MLRAGDASMKTRLGRILVTVIPLVGCGGRQPLDNPGIDEAGGAGVGGAAGSGAGGAAGTAAATSALVLFGGAVGVSTFRDTWTWDGSRWTSRTPATRPA